MQDYVHFQPIDFAQDEFFIRWVKNNDTEAEVFWQNWMAVYPFKQSDIVQGRQLVLSSFEYLHMEVDEAELMEMKAMIYKRIDRNHLDLLHQRWNRSFFWKVAATVVLTALIGALLWLRTTPSGDEGLLESKNSNKADWIETHNPSSGEKLVLLPDGSSVVLKARSKLIYPSRFNSKTRTVRLEGEAFFEVNRNPDQPFVVLSQNWITKVLGTSFSVKAYPGDPKVDVNVKTGKVSVFSSDDLNLVKRIGGKILEGTVLEANESAQFSESYRGRVSSPPNLSDVALVNPSIDALQFEYKETPVNEIFNQLQLAYTINFDYDRSVFHQCPVTASLTGEPLANKLDLICKAIRAKYIIDGDTIRIQGRGCQ